MRRQFAEIRDQIRALIGGFDRTQLIREDVLVTLVGKPNVGKSSLFNALLERDRALVSALPHTTRDHLEEPLEIQGFFLKHTARETFFFPDHGALVTPGIDFNFAPDIVTSWP